MLNPNDIYRDIVAIRENTPLIHNITNFVVMNNTANSLLSLGASPVMAHAPEEVKDMATLASCLVINIGTLNAEWIKGMKLAMKRAEEMDTPIVLDPVGAGATLYRNETAHVLLSEYSPTVVRGNASEIMTLANKASKTKGVDSIDKSDAARSSGRLIANNFGCTVVISGATDYVISNGNERSVMGGEPLMSKVTGMGCTASALIGAFLAVNNNPEEASAHAMAIMNIAGETAAKHANGPGSLQLHFLDALYNLNSQQISTYFSN